MKKILMISYYYPPLEDVGSLRALAFSKYLPEYGWEPYVLSVKNPDKNWCVLGDSKPPQGIKVFYTLSLINLTWITGKLNGLLSRILKPFGIKLNKPLVRDLLCIPDQFIGWIPLTFIEGLKLIKKNNIDLIYVSCKPFSSAIIGAFLKYITKRPLILDFRDPISPVFYNFDKKYYKFLPTFYLNTKIEEMILRYVDRLIFVQEETKNLYLSYFPFLNKKVYLIYNGFMEEYFSTNPEPFKKFTIVYSGNFYSELVPPDPFFKALQKVINEDNSLKDKIQFLYVGNNSDWLVKMTDKYGLNDTVKVTGYVPRLKSIEYICRSSLMLLRIVPPMISTKLFEGLAAGAPILALVNEGEVAKIIRKYSNSSHYIVKPDDVAGIGQAIKDAYNKWKSGELKKKRNPLFYDDFNKKNLTAKFVKILNLVVNDNIFKEI